MNNTINAKDIFIQIFSKLMAQRVSIDFSQCIHEIEDKLSMTIPKKLHDSLAILFSQIVDLSFLKKYFAEEFNEIILHNYKNISIEKSGKIKKERLSIAPEIYQLALEFLTMKNKVSWNESKPFSSFYANLFGKNVRITLIASNITSQSCPIFCIRYLNDLPFLVSSFGDDEKLIHLTTQAIIKKKNIIISGATGSGKTSYIKALTYGLNQEHIITLEDTKELAQENTHWSGLLANEKQNLSALLSYSMRLRPDRILLGEVRSHEVEPLFLALNTGHRGIMTTLHANNAVDALHRLSLLFSLYQGRGSIQYQSILKLFCRNIDLIIHLEDKEVVEIIAPKGVEGDDIIFESQFRLDNRENAQQDDLHFLSTKKGDRSRSESRNELFHYLEN